MEVQPSRPGVYKDADGQHWYVCRLHGKWHRTRAVEKICEGCNKPFHTSQPRQRKFCSRACSWSSLHETWNPKTVKEPGYHQDRTGQWWYVYRSNRRDGWARTRAEERSCSHCGTRFFTERKSTQATCSQSCGKIAAASDAYVNSDGYILRRISSDDPMIEMAMNRTKQVGWVLEHRLVMARLLGRSLHRQETVHHINGDAQDNRPENLQLRWGRHGKGAVLQCADCGSHNLAPVTLF